MFLAQYHERLTLHLDTANLRTLLVSRASLWTALRVVHDISVWFNFVQAKDLKLGVLPMILHPALCSIYVVVVIAFI